MISSRSQIVTLNNSGNKRGTNLKYLPYVFTEYGIIMLSGLLKSDIAAQVNIKVIEAFIEMRKIIKGSQYEVRLSNVEQKMLTYDNKLIKHDNQFEELFSKFKQEENTHLFFEGQIYDANSLLLDIFNNAKKEIIIIDNFVDKKMFDILSKLNINVLVISENINEELYKKYKKQYQNVDIKTSFNIHDRFIIIDKKVLYHSGASFKDLGKKCFAITKIENEDILEHC